MTIAEVNKKYNVNLPEILMPDEIGNPEKWEKEVLLMNQENGFLHFCPQ